MRPCKKCSKNDWRYEYDEGWVTATCLKCGYKTSFMANRRKSINKQWCIIFEMLEGRLTPEEWTELEVIGLKIHRNLTRAIGMSELEPHFKKSLFGKHNSLIWKRRKILFRHLKVEDMRLTNE